MDGWSAIGASNERVSSSSISVQKIRRYIDESGLTLVERSFGEFAQASTCTISSSDGFRTEGHGKGIGSQCMASALFEAIEHYHYFKEDVQSLVSSSELDLSNNGSYLVGGSPPVEKMFAGSRAALSCVQFESLLNPSVCVDFPLALLNPYYEAPTEAERKAIRNTGLYRYATNSGTASGVNKDEALLHAILELIERDAVGLMVVRCALRERALPVSVVSQDSLPKHSLKIIESVSEQADAKIEIFDITSEIGVPTFMCSLESNEAGKYRFFGSGSSCLAEYALERGVLEAFQGYCLQFKFGKKSNPLPSKPLQSVHLRK